MTDDTTALRPRMDALEREVARIAGELETLRAAPAVVAPAIERERVVPDPPIFAAYEPEVSSAVERARFERLLVTRATYAAGIVLVFIGAALFLKYAIDNAWIGLQGRVALGLLAGIGAMVTGERTFRPDRRIASGGLTVLGGALLYLSLWAAWQPDFHVMPRIAALALMTLVTIALGLLASRRKDEALAFGMLLGGTVAPLLGVDGHLASGPLAVYLVALDAAAIALTLRFSWTRVAVGALVGTALLALNFLGADEATGVACATAVLVPFVALALLRRSRTSDAILLVALAGWSLGLHSIFRLHPLSFAAVMLAASGLSFACALRIRRRSFAWAAVGLATVALPAQIHGAHLLLVLALEAIFLGFAALRNADRVLLWIAGGMTGFVLTALAVTSSFVPPDPVSHVVPFVNVRFLTFAVLALGSGFLAWDVLRTQGSASTSLRAGVGGLRVFAGSMLLVGISENLAGGVHAVGGPQNVVEVVRSIVWATIAALGFAAGLRLRDEALRWGGLAVIAATVLKVLCIDLASLEIGPRIASSLAVGVMLTLLSFVYQLRFSAKDAS